MLRPGKRFYRRPNGPTAFIVLLMAIVTVPTAIVLTVRARADMQTAEDQATLDEVVAAYEASRDAAPRRYLMVIKNDSDVYVTYRDGGKLHKAKYAMGPATFGQPIDIEAVARDSEIMGDTLESILAWTQGRLAENAQVYDGTTACNIWPDGHNRFEGGQKTTHRPDEVSGIAFIPTLRGIGWPSLGLGKSAVRLISTDRYALDQGLVCVEEQHEVIRNGRERIMQATRFYLDPERDYLCERKHEPSHNAPPKGVA